MQGQHNSAGALTGPTNSNNLVLFLSRHSDWWCHVCRDSTTQLALLDRVAGTSGLAANFAVGVQSRRQMKQQLADIAALGDEEEREELQDMITEVVACCRSITNLTCGLGFLFRQK